MGLITLKLQETLDQKDLVKFGITNSITLRDFYGYQYAVCLGAVFKNDKKEYAYREEFSRILIDHKVKPNQLMSFCELHKDIILKEKNFVDGKATTYYYLLYMREEKPTLLNEFILFGKKNVDIELIFNYNGYYRAEEIHLFLSENTSVLSAIQVLFSNENKANLPFITVHEDNYMISYYNDFGMISENLSGLDDD